MNNFFQAHEQFPMKMKTYRLNMSTLDHQNSSKFSSGCKNELDVKSKYQYHSLN